MKNVILAAAVFATTVFGGIAYVDIHRAEWAQESCLETAICYKPASLK